MCNMSGPPVGLFLLQYDSCQGPGTRWHSLSLRDGERGGGGGRHFNSTWSATKRTGEDWGGKKTNSRRRSSGRFLHEGRKEERKKEVEKRAVSQKCSFKLRDVHQSVQMGTLGGCVTVWRVGAGGRGKPWHIRHPLHTAPLFRGPLKKRQIKVWADKKRPPIAPLTLPLPPLLFFYCDAKSPGFGCCVDEDSGNYWDAPTGPPHPTPSRPLITSFWC